MDATLLLHSHNDTARWLLMGWTLYSWVQVRDWFVRHYPASDLDRVLLSVEHDRLIAAADHLVRARALMRGDDLATGLAALIPA
ncbi:MAG: hypothetical protein M3529_14315 [Actinomycetota bacterium]|nr:hypothetical protein [Actinomycetota bacterium]MDQ3463876.1 hypothetical protein [Actinomycetota bacterium]